MDMRRYEASAAAVVSSMTAYGDPSLDQERLFNKPENKELLPPGMHTPLRVFPSAAMEPPFVSYATSRTGEAPIHPEAW